MTDVHVSNLEKLYPDLLYVDAWLTQTLEEVEGDGDKGDIFFFAMAYFNAFSEECACFETREEAIADAKDQGVLVLDRPDEVAIPFPVYARIRKGRIKSTGMLSLEETLDWLNQSLEEKSKTMVLRFADQHCKDLAWYSTEGNWEHDEPKDTDLAPWFQGIMDALSFDSQKK